MGSNGRNWIRRQLDELNTAPTPKQIAVGGASGWLAGYAFAKVGKIAAISIGGSLLIMQIASHQGFIKVNWAKVNKGVAKAKKELERRAARRLPWIMEEAEDFVKENLYLATGFAGGFLIGLACS
ncbi:FUN14 domain-containing protein 1, variant 3 [Chamberlinius hualienensis]